MAQKAIETYCSGPENTGFINAMDHKTHKDPAIREGRDINAP